ncbi:MULTISPECIES: histidine phosphatase family protein [unclassified Pseudomonas]|uniref:lipopolysaccharide core heptose(II)-phosphate phosphatase PmrG n=1 Tax=unclassified Pseudomonas TaxID=196821 RepID=UPI002AC8EA75|nr:MULTISPECIES: histidine phosphatase family protein [unclassified Pseudomonas]MEB0042072.1 histidine phosphatase family protein [Pseudomonas sp. MH10]MEB0076543.1 histidine phosphatase family protein [Pseudomonas sp. MH10out]MEB0091291.1 histidine phosphatase family protein [Pseudomonas sp. CCI4.2]MEB0101499.1 histidine phosphatase family protein [Pseudomonas sp. CCI3.2]MEB0119782.1 histidine phosphatase family protein [Pseudomonas sp. CCI1.2]
METVTRLRSNSLFVWRTLGRYRIVSVALLIGLLGVAAYAHFKHPVLKNFAHGSAAEIANLKASWSKGEIIVFVRHAERCDQSDATCLSAKDGITTRGSDAARDVGKEFERLGLDNTDVYASPLARTTQTAAFMFNREVDTRTWLADCRATMLTNAIKHKAVGRNLVLVTHSDCIREVEKGLKVFLPAKPAYTSSLFISLGENTHPHALGFIDAAPFAADFKHEW